MKTRESEKTGAMKKLIGHDGGGNKSKRRRVMRILMNSVDILRGGISKVSREMRWQRGLQFVTMMLIVCMTVFISPDKVYADTTNLLANADGSDFTAYNWVGGTGANTCLRTDDAGTTSAEGSSGNGQIISVNLDDFTPTEDSIDSVDVFFICEQTGTKAVTITPYVIVNSTTYNAAATTTIAASSAWTTYSQNIPNTGSWTSTQMDGMEAGISGKGTQNCTQIYARVNHTPKYQSLVEFKDDSSSGYAEMLNLQMATIGTNAPAVGYGYDITSTTVEVKGSLTALDNIKVWWKAGADDFASADPIATETPVSPNTPYAIALSGVGNESGYIYYTIDIPLGAEGTYSLEVSAFEPDPPIEDSLPLPRETATQMVFPPAQTLDYFTDYGKNFNKNADAPATDLLLAKIKSYKTASGRELESTNVTFKGTMNTQTPNLANIKVWWNDTGDFPPPGGSGIQLVGTQTNVYVDTPYEIPLTNAGYNNGWLYYTITFDNTSATGSYFLNISTVTGISQDNLPLPMETTENFATSKYYIQVCGDCHAYPPIDGASRDSATGAVLGIHSTHSRFNPMRCDTCHGDTTSLETDMAHRDGKIQIKATLGSQGAYGKAPFTNQTSVPTTTNDTCSSLACHNSTEKPANDRDWFTGGPISCDDCHISTVADVDDYEFRLFTTSSVPRLLQSEWLNRGHGATANYELSGNKGADMACDACHDPAIPHGDPSIPYKTNGTGDQDIFCLNCHGDAATRGTLFAEVAADTQNIRTHSYSVFSSVGYGSLGAWRVKTFKCIDCHDPHGDSNLEMVQKKAWTGGSDSKGRPLTYYNGYSTVEFTAFVGAGGYGMGDNTTETYICEVCHTTTTFHTQGGNGADHYNGIKCSDCHEHSKGWAPLEKCTECHAVARDYFYGVRQITGAGGDFTRLSRHVSNGTAEEIVTSYDCIVCHMEGDYAAATAGTGYTDNNNHNESTDPNVVQVNLRNVDDVGHVGYDWNKFNVTEAMRTDMDTFCLNCHDDDGALDISVNGSTDGLAVPASRPLTPFNKLDTLKNGRDGFPTRTRVVDVKTQFYEGTNGPGITYNGNPSQHAVLGARYGSNNAGWSGAWTDHQLRTNNNVMSTIREKAELHCSDCHLSETNAHGAEKAWHMLENGTPNVYGTVYDPLVPTGQEPSTHPASVVCYKCHDEAVYCGNCSPAGGSRHDHSADADWDKNGGFGGQGTAAAKLGASCFNCHAGGGYGNIHGMSGTYIAGPQTNTSYRFMPGAWMNWSPSATADDWSTSGSTGTCYLESSSNWTNCGQHSGSSKGGGTAAYARDTTY